MTESVQPEASSNTTTNTDRPWLSEPSAYDETFTDGRYRILLRRNRMGAWCGYVGVREGHSLYGIKYNETVRSPTLARLITKLRPSYYDDGDAPTLEQGLSVHGGVTWANPAAALSEAPADAAGWWTIGFDCAHSYDQLPIYTDDPKFAEIKSALNQTGAVYRTIEFAKREAGRLAAQMEMIDQACRPGWLTAIRDAVDNALSGPREKRARAAKARRYEQEQIATARTLQEDDQ